MALAEGGATIQDANCQAGENVPGLKGKKTVSLTAQRDFKLQKGSCNKCWADNNSKCCWYPTGAQPCDRCNALKRACTFSGRKSHERGKAFAVAQRRLATAGSTTSTRTASPVLPTAQEQGIAVDVAVLEPTTPQGKAKVAATPQKWRASLSGDKRPAKQSRSGTGSQKVAKAVPC
ncbi:hypothetical protein C0992_000532 [Termitomyces sp. T32_za158]|nr:hypothetical protein C0992_000532 [Termitomyces sp. T32_za158]